MYKVLYSQLALKELRKLDKNTRKFILAWIEKNLVDCTNPRQHGKALSANGSVQWRYRIGDYRLLVNIKDDDLIILLVSAGHRKDIYR